MSHIQHQFERDENTEINNCPRRAVPVLMTLIDFGGEEYTEWGEESQCDVSERVSVGKDRCRVCGKVFTY